MATGLDSIDIGKQAARSMQAGNGKTKESRGQERVIG
jgi:hypothetical protein